MIRRTWALGALVAAAACATAPAAGAATSIGQVFAPTAQTTATVVQTGIGSGQGYTVPSDGVITSWTFQADAAGATVRLKVARRDPDNNYAIVGESEFQTAAPNQLGSYPTRVAVKAGDVIGTAASDGKSVAYTGNDPDTVALSAGDQPVGSSGPYSDVHGIRMDVTANIEPDIDGDQFGDETQDKCTNDPTLQTACSADLFVLQKVVGAVHYPGEQVTFTVDAVNRGPSLATASQVLVDLSPELTFVSATPTTGSCAPTKVPILCSLGDIQAGSASVITVTAIAKDVGVASAAAKASSSTADPNVSNNSGGATTRVAWRPGTCANLFPGSAKNDVARGTLAGDKLEGFDGNDVINGLRGADCIFGGDGNDRLSGGDGNDLIEGGAGDDRIDGGTGRDRVSGGAGNDTINVADRQADVVNCGTGRDKVTIDSHDRVRGCERVTRVKKKKRRSG